MAQLTATDNEAREVRPAGIYRIKVKEIVQMESQDSKYGDPIYLLWVCDATKGKWSGELADSSSRNFGPKAKARQWAEILLGRPIKSGETIDTDDLVGCVADAVVEVQKRDDGSEKNKFASLVAVEDDERAAF